MKPNMIAFVRRFVDFTDEEIAAAHSLFEEKFIKKENISSSLVNIIPLLVLSTRA
jgi:hypothetical protein